MKMQMLIIIITFFGISLLAFAGSTKAYGRITNIEHPNTIYVDEVFTLEITVYNGNSTTKNYYTTMTGKEVGSIYMIEENGQIANFAIYKEFSVPPETSKNVKIQGKISSSFQHVSVDADVDISVYLYDADTGEDQWGGNWFIAKLKGKEEGVDWSGFLVCCTLLLLVVVLIGYHYSKKQKQSSDDVRSVTGTKVFKSTSSHSQQQENGLSNKPKLFDIKPRLKSHVILNNELGRCVVCGEIESFLSTMGKYGAECSSCKTRYLIRYSGGIIRDITVIKKGNQFKISKKFRPQKKLEYWQTIINNTWGEGINEE